MITTILDSSPNIYEFRGLSTDTKPTNDWIGNGSVYFEMDTSKAYMYSKSGTEAGSWVEII